MTSDQVRWKINALLKKYKEVIDNFSKSGRGNIEFEWFQTMDDIFGKKSDVANQNYAVSSKVNSKKDKAYSQSSNKKRSFESSCLPSSSHLEKESYESSNKSPKKNTANLPFNETDINSKDV